MEHEGESFDADEVPTQTEASVTCAWRATNRLLSPSAASVALSVAYPATK